MPDIDSSLFADSAVEPAVAAFNSELEDLLKTVPATHEVAPEETRQAREDGKGPLGPVVRVDRAEDRSIPGPGGQIPVRILVPDEVRGVYLHFHGGGWVLGAPHHSDVLNWELAEASGLAVVSVDYRLAPEHPYPAGPDDCEAAALWLVDNASREFGSDRLLIGGESAGAHLSVVTLMRLRDRHGSQAFQAANLIYGCYDLALTPSARNWGNRQLILSTPTVDWFVAMFAAGRDLTDPDLSPLLGDLEGLPSALFSVGTADPLLDDSLFMFGRWLAAGGDAQLAIYPGGIHGFNQFADLPIAATANARAAAFLASD